MQITTDPPAVLLQAVLLRQAIEKTEYALRSLTEHTPPLLGLAAHGLMLSLEHVRTLQAIEDDERKASKKAKASGGRPAGVAR